MTTPTRVEVQEMIAELRAWDKEARYGGIIMHKAADMLTALMPDANRLDDRHIGNPGSPPPMTAAEKDYLGMREFQAKFIEADHALREARAEIERLTDELETMKEQLDHYQRLAFGGAP